MNIEAGEQS